MTDRYVEVDSQRFEAFLQGKGFIRNLSSSEVVYDRQHQHCKHITVRVYTSITDGAQEARKRGADAIRVIAFYDNGKNNFGLAGRDSLARVYRTGSEEKVFERTLERMREAYKITNEWLKKNPWART